MAKKKKRRRRLKIDPKDMEDFSNDDVMRHVHMLAPLAAEDRIRELNTLRRDSPQLHSAVMKALVALEG